MTLTGGELSLMTFWNYCSCIVIYFPVETDVFKTSSGRLKKVATSYNQIRCCCDVLQKTSNLQHLEDVRLMMSWGRLIYDVLRTSDLRRLEDIWFTLSWRRLIFDVMKTSNLRRLADVWFTTSWRRPIYEVWRHLIYVVLMMSHLQRPEDV